MQNNLEKERKNKTKCVLYVIIKLCCSMYDVDGNGWIDLLEMTKIVKSIYKMMGPNHQANLLESPAKRAEDIFRRMDVDNDGRVTRQEFVRCSLNDPRLLELLAPNTRYVAGGPSLKAILKSSIITDFRNC